MRLEYPYTGKVRAVEMRKTANIAHLVCGHEVYYNKDTLPKIGEKCECDKCKN